MLLLENKRELFLLVGALTLAACTQVLDENAAIGSPIAPPPPESDAGMSTVILPGPPPYGFYDNSGEITTSEDPCDATRSQATTILETHCASCHGGRTPGERAGNPPFDFLLDPRKLASTFTNNTTPPMLFVAPGDPDHSRLYLRARRGDMPPLALTDLRRPTVSDISVLRQWISNCLGARPVPPSGGAPPNAGGPEGSDGGAAEAAP